jgi:hypothetical protein
MNKRALIYAGFLTAAVAVLLTSARVLRSIHGPDSPTVAANR